MSTRTKQMNKSILINSMAKISKETKATAKRCLHAFLEIVSEELKKNRHVVLTGFGTFRVVKRKARVGVNPMTNKKMQIPARKVPQFKAGKNLKSLVK